MEKDFPAIKQVPDYVVICDRFGVPLKQVPDALVTGGGVDGE
ncbi:MAG: hypothetical protein WC117_00025 [Sphaerochaetaceae bacterium]|jgi:hypothetical protein